MQSVDNIGTSLFSLNVCRCCHSIGLFKDLSTECSLEGKEIYEDLLRITFDIEISSYTNGEAQSSKQICDNCISKLIQAFTFRNMVISSENRMAEYFNKLQKNENAVSDGRCDETMIKTEILPKEEMEDPDYMENYNNDDDRNDDEYMIIKEMIESESDEVDEPRELQQNEAETKNRKSKRPKTNKDKSQQNEKTNWSRIAERRGPGPILRKNSLQLIENSTMFVFQWNKSRYYCYICKQPFIEIASLREHYDTHTLESLERKIINEQNRLVKVEISSLNCLKCYESFNKIDDLQHHLINKHNMEFPLQDNLLVPFKIQSEGLKCQICSENFKQFRLLNIHINKHYKNHVCHICGTSFTNLVFLNLHKSRSHKTYQCTECNLNFDRQTEKKNHDVNVHNVKYERKSRFPCQYCDERFYQENLKIQHLVDKHGMEKPDNKCPLCSKNFITKSLCNNHIRNVHKKEKKHECDICHHIFYTKSDVMRHRVTHTGEKRFCCDTCNTLFATKDSLTRHIKRAHVVNN